MTTKEIFAANQILTVEIAKLLIGKKIACTNTEYKYNTPSVSEFIVGEIISEWDDAANRIYPDSEGLYPQYENYQDYWKSYMSERTIDECMTNLLLLDNNGNRQYKCSPKYNNWFNEPTFFGSDADREVYYVVVKTATKSVNMYDTEEPAIIEGKSYIQVPFEKLSKDSQKRLKGCIGVIDERGKEHWFTPDHFSNEN